MSILAIVHRRRCHIRYHCRRIVDLTIFAMFEDVDLGRNQVFLLLSSWDPLMTRRLSIHQMNVSNEHVRNANPTK